MYIAVKKYVAESELWSEIWNLDQNESLDIARYTVAHLEEYYVVRNFNDTKVGEFLTCEECAEFIINKLKGD